MTRELIERNLKNGTIHIDFGPHDNSVVAYIGDYWFYFLDPISAEVHGIDTIDDFAMLYNISLTAHMILHAIKNLESEDEQAYYEAVLKESPHWAEVVCDYIDESDGFWRVDAFPTGENIWGHEEEGTVIAYIDDLSGRVLYNDPFARTDSMAQAVIQEKIDECKKAHPFSVKELENVVCNVVDYESGEEYEDAVCNLDSFGISEEMARFFGFEAS